MNAIIKSPQVAADPRRFAVIRGKSAAGLVALAGGLFLTGHAVAQTVPGGIGAQLNLMSGEGANAGSTMFSAGCYLGAAICFFLGVWALWQSRQPQNRETGYVGRGLAGLVLCGLFASAGVWIGKAAVSTSGAAATINSATPALVTFGGG